MNRNSEKAKGNRYMDTTCQLSNHLNYRWGSYRPKVCFSRILLLLLALFWPLLFLIVYLSDTLLLTQKNKNKNIKIRKFKNSKFKNKKIKKIIDPVRIMAQYQRTVLAAILKRNNFLKMLFQKCKSIYNLLPISYFEPNFIEKFFWENIFLFFSNFGKNRNDAIAK